MPSDATPVLIVLIRWLHAIAAIVWIGSAVTMLIATALSTPVEQTVSTALSNVFRELTDIAIPVFLLTGALLTFERFSREVPSTAYIAALSAKLVLAFGMFHLGYRHRRAGIMTSPGVLRGFCLAGLAITLLATALKALTGVPT